MTDTETSVCVVAHPDDEVLWFPSLLHEVTSVIVAYCDVPGVPGIGEARRRAMERLPYDVVTLNVPEAGTYDAAHWQDPSTSSHGLRLDATAAARQVRDGYRENYLSIRANLGSLIPENARVYTHNPWGEYGHADHVQVYRAISDLRETHGLSVFVSPYFSTQSAPLAGQYAESRSAEPELRRIDSGVAEDMAAIYKRFGCWTWADDWYWNHSQYLLPEPRRISDGDPANSILETNRVSRIPSNAESRVQSSSESCPPRRSHS